MTRTTKSKSGFTLVELLVVIGIIALLISILLPSLRKAREAANNAKCLSNLRQWGMAFTMYADSHKGSLPFDGDDGSTAATPVAGDPPTYSGMWNEPAVWFNALPPYVNVKPYCQINDVTNGHYPPGIGDNSIFICPSASAIGINGDQFYPGTGSSYYGLYGKETAVAAATLRPAIFSYVINSKLFKGVYSINKMNQMRPGSDVVLMVDKMLVPGEINAAGPGYTAPTKLAQPKAAWNRMTTRHKKGGNLLFADGHVDWAAYTTANPLPAPTTGLGYNLPGRLVWNPKYLNAKSFLN